MKIHNFMLASLAFSLMLAAPAAFARDAKAPRSSSDTIVYRSAQAESSGGGTHFGVGYSTIPGIGSLTGSPVVMLQLSDRHLLQFHLFFPGTNPFQFIGGGYYKYSVVERNSTGFHIGGGVLAGSLASNFALQGQLVAGIHFPVPGTNNDVMFHFDGGPTLTVTGGGNTNFYVGANSGLLGATIAYMF